MTKTSNDVCAEALRRIARLSSDEDAADSDFAFAKTHMDAILAEVAQEPNNLGFEWDAESVPDAAFRPLAWLVAVDIAPHFERPSEARATALMRLRAFAKTDDRPLRADFDDDGKYDANEEDADRRSAFY